MNFLKTGLLMIALMSILLVAGHFLDRQYGGNSFTMAFLILGLGINFVSYWYSDKIVLALYRAKPVSEREMPDLYEIVRRLSTRAKIPVPKMYITPMDAPNAFATGRNPSHAVVCVTEGLLRLLPRREIEGVLAHELSHVKHYDTLIMSICAAIAGSIMFMGRMVFWSGVFGGRRRNDNPLGLIFLMIIAPVMAILIKMAISRSREYKADEGGGKISGDPDSLANALLDLEEAAKRSSVQPIPATSHLFIVNPAVGKGRGIFDLISTHPATAKRVARLRKQARIIEKIG